MKYILNEKEYQELLSWKTACEDKQEQWERLAEQNLQLYTRIENLKLILSDKEQSLKQAYKDIKGLELEYQSALSRIEELKSNIISTIKEF